MKRFKVRVDAAYSEYETYIVLAKDEKQAMEEAKAQFLEDSGNDWETVDASIER